MPPTPTDITITPATDNAPSDATLSTPLTAVAPAEPSAEELAAWKAAHRLASDRLEGAAVYAAVYAAVLTAPQQTLMAEPQAAHAEAAKHAERAYSRWVEFGAELRALLPGGGGKY